jgi:beta-galactosidase
MVNQHYNHPCIFFWGLSNEAKVDDKTFSKAKIEGYVSQIKALDSERMVGLVCHAQVNPSDYFGDPTNIDWVGNNLYNGWYQNTSSNNPTLQINTSISNTVTRVGKAYALSEYGCGGTQGCHSETPSSTTNKGSGGARHDIEYMMWLHEGHIAAIKNKPEIMFTSQWQLFDIAVSNRNEGYTLCADGVNAVIDDDLRRLNDKGLVERDHVTKKDPFYLYKAWWNPTPFVHICQKNYTKMADRVIKCYTNQTTDFALKVNGTTVETKAATDNILTFTGHTFSSGDVVTVESGNISDTFTFE